MTHRIPDKLFVTQGKEIERILRRAVRHALLEHKRAGNPIAVSEDGKVVLIPAEEIEIEDEHGGTQRGLTYKYPIIIYRGERSMTKTVDISEAQAQLPELLSLALEGNEVIISDGDKPVARLIPFAQASQQRVADLNKGEIWTSDDFDEPLPDEFWTGAE